MSLVGSLEDLALGDILQIVSLSRKSGLLLLRSEEGDGRIFFREGLVQAAYVKGGPEDLRALLVSEGFVQAASLEAAVEAAQAEGRSPDDVIAECTGLSSQRLEALRREHVERAVLRMFSWRVGEFSFEVRNDMDAGDLPLALPNGLNAQYLTIEATRLGDEGQGEAPASAGAADGLEEDLVLSGDEAPEQPSPLADAAEPDAELPASPLDSAAGLEDPTPASDSAAHEALAVGGDSSAHEALAVGGDSSAHEALAVGGDSSAHEALAVATAASFDSQAEPAGEAQPPELEQPGASTQAAPAPAAPAEASFPLVVIDPDLPALEWVKCHLTGMFSRVHIFQHTEGGIARIRQYLSRNQVPVVLVSTRAPADSITESADVPELLGRLRAQASRMPIVAMCESDAEAPLDAAETPTGVDGADALVMRPSVKALADPKQRAGIDGAGQDLRAGMHPWAHPSGEAPHAVPAIPRPRRSSNTDATLRALKDMSERLRDRATRGEVLNLVLEFAAERFRRVAMFMVREDEAVGIAQRGLPRAGGPDDQAFLALRVPLHESAWLRSVLDTGESLRAGPSDEGDHRLAARLGSRLPIEAFVAPIESGGRIAALLYADNLPEGRPISDTTVLSIVLHEAGMALDRAVLERALAQADGSRR